jgi:hypothetical protein
MVQSFFKEGEFSKSSGSMRGPNQHDMTFGIGLTVNAPSRCNLAVINAPASTAAQVAIAMEAMQDAAYVADELMDELFDIVYQVLMDARNVDLGLAKGIVANRWVGSLQKDSPLPSGELVTLTGEVLFTCRTSEAVLGEAGVAAVGGVTVNLSGLYTGATVVTAFPDTPFTWPGGELLQFENGDFVEPG